MTSRPACRPTLPIQSPLRMPHAHRMPYSLRMILAGLRIHRESLILLPPGMPGCWPGSRRSPSSPGRSRIVWCDGSDEEWDRLTRLLVEQAARSRASTPRSVRTASTPRSDPSDVARVEDRTYICSDRRGRRRAHEQLARSRQMRDIFRDAVRRLHARPDDVRRPVLHGPARLTAVGARRRDHRLRLRRAVDADDDSDGQGRSRRARRRRRSSCPVSTPSARRSNRGRHDVPWPCNSTKYISHFPETREIWSYGSGYGGNALLGKKCYALRIASVMARDEGWLAEHMLILKLTPPSGETRYITAAFPVRVRQDQPGDARPRPSPAGRWRRSATTSPGCASATDGRLYAINPEAGFFGVAPGTGQHTNPNAIATLWGNAIFTNVALTDDGDVWWEGLTERAAGAPDRLEGPRLDARVGRAGCPPQRPLLRAGGAVPDDRAGVGRPGRRAGLGHPVRWTPGQRGAAGHRVVARGSTVSSSAPTSRRRRPRQPRGRSASLRRDPFAMLPFCGYNMGDYIGHWLSHRRIGRRRTSCRSSTTSTGSARTRTARSCGRASARTAGCWSGSSDGLDGNRRGPGHRNRRLPTRAAFDIEGLDIDDRAFDVLLSVDADVWRQEAGLIPAFLRARSAIACPRRSGTSTQRCWRDSTRLTERRASHASAAATVPCTPSTVSNPMRGVTCRR